MSTDIVALFKCLADKSRLQIITSLTKEDMYVERLAERLGLSPPTVSFHLKKLELAGIVTARKEQYYTMYSLCRNALTFNVLEIILKNISDNAEDERDAAYRQSVLSNFMEYGKLKSIPTQRKKRNIVLEEISKSFELNKKYTEREVNIIIADFHDDFCTIRREMIGLKLLIRKDGIYEKK
ncbi:MAG: metalloregulator ArsR/SmtB family transcription factor [Defluviitaleaceae bacterium]|nr:metalloregulator ArsR/SmtB family transcription factor [Defluviitaleaceae bacterium]